MLIGASEADGTAIAVHGVTPAMPEAALDRLPRVAAGFSAACRYAAALFLRRFVERAAAWAHFDVHGWTPTAKPGRREGGEVQMAHRLFAPPEARYGAKS